MKKYEVSEEFIKEAYTAACDGWKERIKNEFPEVFEVKKLEVGKWYKNLTWKGSYMLYNGTEKDGNFRCVGVVYDGGWLEDGDWGIKDDYVLATPEEVKAMLLKEAEKRGYKEGVKVVSPYDTKHTFTIRNGVFFLERNLSLIDDNPRYGDFIFFKGKWAEIINENKEIIERIESLQKELEELKDRVK